MLYDDIKMFAIIRIIRRTVHHFSYTSLGERKILETRLMESVLTVSFVRRESKRDVQAENPVKLIIRRG